MAGDIVIDAPGPDQRVLVAAGDLRRHCPDVRGQGDMGQLLLGIEGGLLIEHL